MAKSPGATRGINLKHKFLKFGRREKMNKILQILGAFVLAIAAGGAQAIPLSDLLAGQSITAGDKVFDEWRLISEIYSDPSLTVDPSNIDVTALNDGGLDPGPGLSFSVSNGALDVTGDGLYAFIDYMFGFRVTVTDPAFLIKDNSLHITNALVTNSGDNGVAIQEFVGTDPTLVEVPGDSSLPDLGVKYVEFSYLDPTFGGPGLIDNLTDSVSFDPQSQIWVSKDILVWASDTNETASLTGFEQRFSQVASVPEPSTWLLMVAGAAGLGLGRRKRRA
jgi:hypothetical protein